MHNGLCWEPEVPGSLQFLDVLSSSTENDASFLCPAKDVRTHPPKLLLVWQSNLLIFLGPFFRNAYISSLTRSSGGPFIVLGALSLWRWENSLTFAIMMVFRGWQSHHYPAIGLLGRWFAITLVFSLCRRRRAGRGRSLEEIQEGPIEYAFSKMSNDCPRNTVRNPIWDANY